MQLLLNSLTYYIKENMFTFIYVKIKLTFVKIAIFRLKIKHIYLSIIRRFKQIFLFILNSLIINVIF